MIAEGDLIGNYRILAKLGTGGMGTVFLAEHPLIRKRVALKVIHRELVGNREVVQRFAQEARAVNAIGSPHIVEIHDFGHTHSGEPFYIMEYLEGRTLAAVIDAERKLAPARAIAITVQLATGLAAAHAAGIIHRDLKPDNLMLIERVGQPEFLKILDFGLAKMFTGGASPALTAAGVVLGTPQYMSPEACESKKDVDHRTDVYAVGVLLYQMVCGRLPFDGQSMGEVMIKQVTQQPPAPRSLEPSLTPGLEEIIMRCLAKSADARFPTMQALVAALQAPPGRKSGRSATVAPPKAAKGPSRAMSAAGLPLPAPNDPEATLAAAAAGLAVAPVAARTLVEVPRHLTAAQQVVAAPAPSRAWLWGLGGATLAMLVAVVVVVIVRRTTAPPRSVVVAPTREITTRSLGGGPSATPLTPASGTGSGSASDTTAGSGGSGSAAITGTVTLDLVGKPVGAEVVDSAGVVRGYLPLQLAVPRGGELVLTFRADGRQPVTEVVVLDRDRRIDVALRRTGGRNNQNGSDADPTAPSGGSGDGPVTTPESDPPEVRPPAGSGSSDLMEPT